MKNKFKNKYRIPSARLQTWDYSKNAKYHITICTKLMHHFFGQIENEKIILSKEGQIAHEILTALPQKFQFLKLDEFQIMPNHIHAIIFIENKIFNKWQNQPFSNSEFTSEQIHEPDLKFLDCLSKINEDKEHENEESIPFLQKPEDITAFEINQKKRGGITGVHNPMLEENLSTALRYFKGKTTFQAHKINEHFKWHPRFFDTIIRNQGHLETIRNYIRNNPKNWGK